jgi:hypothetical protein
MAEPDRDNFFCSKLENKQRIVTPITHLQGFAKLGHIFFKN